MTELTRSQEADKHENGMLKAQVDKLQVELREYRKRLSLNGGSGISRSPPSSTYGTVSRSNSGQKQAAGNFQFDFPKFGATQASNNAHIYGNGVIKRDSGTPPLLPSHPHSQSSSFSGPSPAPAPISRQQSSGGRSMSPASLYGVNSGVATPVTAQGPDPVFATYSTTDNMHGFASTLPQMMNDPFGDLFSPSILKSSNHDATNSYFADVLPQQGKAVPTLPHDASNGGESTAGLNRVFQFNSGSSASDSASPSASSTSQWNANGANSSCGTSPEPSHDSPASGTDKHTGLYMDNTGAQAYSQYANFSQQPSISSNLSNSLTNDNSVFTPSTTQAFDPVMFGDYRENQDSLGGNGGDFTGGFFDDALNTGAFDFGSPSNLFGILQSPQQINAPLKTPNQNQAPGQAPSRNLLAEIEKTRNGGDDDYGLPVSQPSQPSQPAQAQTKDGKKLISCNNIWYVYLGCLVYEATLTLHLGINCNPTPTSNLVPSTSTACAPSSAPKLAARSRASWLTKITSMLRCGSLGTRSLWLVCPVSCSSRTAGTTS